MTKLKITTLILSLMLFSTSQAFSKEPFNSVQELFAAMSAFDYSKMKTIVTDDFQLLEAGEVWNIDTLINVIKTVDKPYKRQNYFNLIKVVTYNNMIWLSYWNKAIIIKPNETSERAWLESVVLFHENDTWKLQMMHSTRVLIENIPKEVIFEEYVNNR
jgi:hypothetical protein